MYTTHPLTAILRVYRLSLCYVSWTQAAGSVGIFVTVGRDLCGLNVESSLRFCVRGLAPFCQGCLGPF